jgi:hypothetical protein
MVSKRTQPDAVLLARAKEFRKVTAGLIVRQKRGKWRPFVEARAFVHTLHLKNFTEWRKYISTGQKPNDIPSAPRDAYEEFAGMGDWLGNGNVGKVKWRPFKKARTFARSLNLKSKTEWATYCKSGKRPSDIPSNPDKEYEVFAGYGGWLGTGNVAPHAIVFRPFKKARAFVRSLGLQRTDWRRYCTSGKKPDDIPCSPDRVYPEWAGMCDWVGAKKKPSGRAARKP